VKLAEAAPLAGGPGADRMFGITGDDTLWAQDLEADLVQGGPGDDVCNIDEVDVKRICESGSVIVS
jgi:hypothetical protein